MSLRSANDAHIEQWLAATYVRPRAGAPAAASHAAPRKGVVVAALTYFAVGCPVCNKLVLLVLGYNGALTWFEPFQPVLQLAAIVLLGCAAAAHPLPGELPVAAGLGEDPRIAGLDCVGWRR